MLQSHVDFYRFTLFYSRPHCYTLSFFVDKSLDNIQIFGVSIRRGSTSTSCGATANLSTWNKTARHKQLTCRFKGLVPKMCARKWCLPPSLLRRTQILICACFRSPVLTRKRNGELVFLLCFYRVALC